MSLIEELKKASTSDYAEVLSNSALMNERDLVRTRIPAINIALSGEVDGGITSGLTIFAGPSRHFKSNLGLIIVSSYLKKYPDAICVFIDNEFGITPEYLKSMDVDPDRVLHVRCETVERMKFEMANQLKVLRDGEENRKKSEPQKRVIFFIDSIGNTASNKEVDDAENEKLVSDMTRAKQIKSFFRIVTPYFATLNIPCVAVNHTYETQEMFSKTVMGGGTGPMYSANNVIFVGRQQEKDGKEIVGYNFILNVEKSRYVKEKSKIPLNVTFDGGINTFSGLLDIAIDVGFVQTPTKGWYSRVTGIDAETGEMVVEEIKHRRSKTDTVEWWKPLFLMPEFKNSVKERYKLGEINTVNDHSEELFGD